MRGINPSLDSPPAVVITAPGTGSSFNTGSAVQFTGVATDSQDGDRTANLVWTSNIDGPIGTGGNFSRTLSDGTHTITAIATDSGGKTGSDSIIITILAPPPPALSVTVTTDKSTYANRNKVFITATVTDGVNRVAGAAAHLEIVKANGSRISSDATSDSYGVARFQYKVNTVRDGLGIHTATVSCSHNGYISGSGSATYQVR